MQTNLIGRHCTVFSADWEPKHVRAFKGRTFTIAALTYAIGVGWYALLVDDATLAFEQFPIGFLKLTPEPAKPEPPALTDEQKLAWIASTYAGGSR